MALCTFGGLALGTAGGELTSWVSPSATPPSACLSSTTALGAFDTPSAAHHNQCSSPATVSARHQHQLQLLPLPQPKQHQQQRHQLLLQQQHQYPHQHCPRPLQDLHLQPQARLLRLANPHHTQAQLQAANVHPVQMARCREPPKLPPAAVPCQTALFQATLEQRQYQQQHQQEHGQGQQQQQLQQLQRQQRRGREQGLHAVPLQRQISVLVPVPLKRAREHQPVGDRPRQSRRIDGSTAPPCSSFTNGRCLQRYNSLDSDAAYSASSFIHAAATDATTAAAASTVTAVAATAVLASVASVSLQLQLPTAATSAFPPPPTGRFLPCHSVSAGLLRPAWEPVGHARPPPRVPCAADGEEFILHASRALQLCPDTSAQLALHLWRRICGMVRLVLSIRHPTADGDDPQIAASTYRIYATACLWLAAKVEERRRVVAEARVLAVLAHASTDVLCGAELRLLAWVEWCPLRGYLPSAPQRLGLGPAGAA